MAGYKTVFISIAAAIVISERCAQGFDWVKFDNEVTYKQAGDENVVIAKLKSLWNDPNVKTGNIK